MLSKVFEKSWQGHAGTPSLAALPASDGVPAEFEKTADLLGEAPDTSDYHDPAMLIWLDARSNHKGNANENLARELMELFSLGIGHYTEHDVKEAARALTGWHVNNEVFTKIADRHDEAEKIILGQTGRWKGMTRFAWCSSTRRPPDAWPGKSASCFWGIVLWVRPILKLIA